MTQLSDTAATLIAICCHEANRKFCIFTGDNSQKPWAESPLWQQESAIKGVHFVNNNPEASDSATHDSWMAEKVNDGWVYGEIKDAEAKTHPCIVPFDQLPADQQFKDKLFKIVAQAGIIGFGAASL
jgi:hypothetical protein